MKTLITASEVISLAFSPEEPYVSTLITPSDIVEAESRHLLPIVGVNLYNAMLQGSYAELVSDYVAPMVAAWTRYIVEPLIPSRTCTIHTTDRITEAMNDYAERQMSALGDKASTLSRRLSDHLNANSSSYAEYNPNSNPLNHCFIYGNIIQVC